MGVVGRAPGALGEGAEVDPFDPAGAPGGAGVERRAGRHVGGRQVRKEGVLVEDRRARPAARAIELYDEAPLVLQLHLVDAVLEGAQRQAAAGAAEASHLDRLEHTVRGEGEEGRAGLVWRAAQCPSAFSIFAQVSRSPTVRLRTRPEGDDSSESTQKYPWRSNW